MELSGFDYEVLHRCEYGVYAGYGNEVVGCGEPATHRVWWADDMSDAMLVCQEHFEVIKKSEELK